MLHHQNTSQLINFSVWTPFKMWSDALLWWSITTFLKKKKKKKQSKTDLKQGIAKNKIRIQNEKSKL